MATESVSATGSASASLQRVDPPKRVQVVTNPASGADKPVLATLNSVFHDAGIEWDVSITNEAGDAAKFARRAAETGVDVIASYGGDGTVAEVVAGLEGCDLPLAILPGGTANVFAAEIGLPMDLASAAAILTKPMCVRPVDVGVLGEERFLVRVGVGLEADTVVSATREAKDRFGVMAYVLGALQSASKASNARYRLTIDGREETAEGVTCVIANSGGLGRFELRLAPDIVVDDGLLDVLVLRSADLAAVTKAITSMATDAPPPEDVASRWKAAEVRVEVEGAEPQGVVRDGEDAGATPITASVLPGAARILVPCDGE